MRRSSKYETPVYRIKIDDLMEYIRRRGGNISGGEEEDEEDKRRRDLMNLLDILNYYILIGIAKALGVFTMTWNRYQR